MRESIDLRLGPSRALCATLVAAYLAALAAVWWALPAWLAAAMSLLLSCSAVVELHRHGLRKRADAVVGLSVRGAAIRLERRDGLLLDGALDPDTVVLPWLVILRVRLPGKGGAAAVVPWDCAAPAAHRRLRVLLRWGAAGRS